MTSSASDVRAADALRLLAARGETLAVAESLTGGLVAAELTGVPGASQVFVGSVTAYATRIKRDVLGVDGDLLAERGAVDPDVALRMAQGVRRALGTDWGIATTGVAGPDPQDGREVGTVYVAVAGPAHAGVPPAAGQRGAPGCPEDGKVVALRLNGDRSENRRESARSVLGLLADQLHGNARAQDTEQNGES
ncbi:putative competence-damage inducible protein [Streptomyces sp. YIM 130001]|uniref:CinA family protein n=1 Tax=Streptomyces sp. YIM 130001 TaxID=2259644 RepID=UPI000E657EF7|nr:CinA family protein [Streptomyces sp. YIM 130001]RII09500.1 putative competence-damage inducible protein [Streptomyces sp. YIM 130001]